MNTFLGWATYSTEESYCDVCETFYDKQDKWEHEDCEEELEKNENNIDDLQS